VTPLAVVPWHLQMAWQESLWLALACVVASVVVRAVRKRSTVVGVALREIAIVVGLFGMWQIVRVYAITKVAGGMANGEAVWRAERALHLPDEAATQRLILGHPLLVQGANLYYLYLHFTAMTVFLIWLFVRHRESYARWRTTLVLTTAACLAVQFIPVAPPRFLAGHHLVDTAVVYGQSVYGAMNTGIADQLSAMPSVHFAWAALITIAVIAVSRSRWRWLIAAHAVLTLAAIVLTANHYWLDAAAAAALLGLALAAQAAVDAAWRRSARRVAPVPAQSANPVDAADPVDA
jgi:PAP2 superfamily